MKTVALTIGALALYWLLSSDSVLFKADVTGCAFFVVLSVYVIDRD